MKSRAELISEIIEIFQSLAHQHLHDQHEPWRRLDVPLAQLKSLFLIHIRGSVSVRDLALELGVTPGNVTSIVDRMVSQGLVTRAESQEDRRLVLLHLTDKGRETINSIHGTRNSLMKRFLERMTRGELAALVLGIKAFLRAMEEDHRELNVNKDVNHPCADISSPPPVHSKRRKADRPA